uniref:ATP-dependent RNA helicase DHX37-like C-terminal domain-containing protein n=1 Tax=Caenorhabditis japonica TaxID=281687 RepID=A0A8R1HKF8_CAEJA
MYWDLIGRKVGPQNTNGWTSGERADCHWGESPTEWASRPPNGRVAHRMGDSPMQTAASPTGMGEAATLAHSPAHRIGKGDSPKRRASRPIRLGYRPNVCPLAAKNYITTRASLKEVWLKNEDWLLQEYLDWVPESLQQQISLMWPPLEDHERTVKMGRNKKY